MADKLLKSNAFQYGGAGSSSELVSASHSLLCRELTGKFQFFNADCAFWAWLVPSISAVFHGNSLHSLSGNILRQAGSHLRNNRDRPVCSVCNNAFRALVSPAKLFYLAPRLTGVIFGFLYYSKHIAAPHFADVGVRKSFCFKLSCYLR